MVIIDLGTTTEESGLVKVNSCWFDMKKIKPTPGVEVLLLTKSKHYMIGYKVEGADIFVCDGFGFEVEGITHWATLPVLPEVVR